MVDQALAQPIYIDFDFPGEASLTRPLLVSTSAHPRQRQSLNLLVVHLRGQAPHGLIVGKLHLIDKKQSQARSSTRGGLAILT